MDIQEEQYVRHHVNDNAVIVQPSIRIAYGKEMLNPAESVLPVSQIIKKYIEDQFATSNSNTERSLVE